MDPQTVSQQQDTIPPQPVGQPQGAVIEEKSSNKKPLIIILILTLLIITGLAFYYFQVMNKKNSDEVASNNATQINPDPVVTSVLTPTPTILNYDDSDPQLDKDIQAINNKMNNLTTDLNNVNSSLNDQPIDLGQ
jgi:hypothetical protein